MTYQYISIPPWATIEKFNAALPSDRNEWAIFPPLTGLVWLGSPVKRKKDSALDPAAVCDLSEPHSTAIKACEREGRGRGADSGSFWGGCLFLERYEPCPLIPV